MSEKKTSTRGLDPNIAAMLSYLLGWVTGLIFFLREDKDEYVRYHAMQSIIVFGAVTVIEVIFVLIPRLLLWGAFGFFALKALVALFAFALWVVLMVKAYQGVCYKLPFAGKLAKKYSAV